nr:tail fiber assembly protein [Pectobacterium carotovorum]
MNRINQDVIPLQDAVDLGIASEEEKSTLNAWKKYRVQLMRLDTSKAPDVEWPEEPVS